MQASWRELLQGSSLYLEMRGAASTGGTAPALGAAAASVLDYAQIAADELLALLSWTQCCFPAIVMQLHSRLAMRCAEEHVLVSCREHQSCQ